MGGGSAQFREFIRNERAILIVTENTFNDRGNSRAIGVDGGSKFER